MKQAAVLSIIVALSAGIASAEDFVRFFPAAASAPGVGDAFFVTDGRLFNPDPVETVTVHLAFLARNQDNRGAMEVAVEIGPRQGAALDDLVASVFGLSNTAGGVRLRADRPFLATSRTYNVGGEAGTFGQFVPGQRPEDALTRGILLQVVNDPTDAGFRSNVGFANPNEVSVTVTVRVFDLDTGELIGEGSRSIPPLGIRQINDVFDFVGGGGTVLRNASVEFEATAPLLGYASVLDNLSDDPIFVLPSADSGGDNRPPVGTIDMPQDDQSIAPGASVFFAGSASDPDGDSVTVLWDFGDDITSTELTPGDHSYPDPGVYAVTFTATDEHGLADPMPDTRTVTVTAAGGATFTRVQTEIFNVSCATTACHIGFGAPEGLRLEEGMAYDNIVNVPSVEQPLRDLIEPGDPSSSYMWLKVIEDMTIFGQRMPPFGDPLSQEQLDLLEAWILDDAPDN